jgi:hypothetical protein
MERMSNFIGNDWQVGTITASKGILRKNSCQQSNQKTVFTQDFY